MTLGKFKYSFDIQRKVEKAFAQLAAYADFKCKAQTPVPP